MRGVEKHYARVRSIFSIVYDKWIRFGQKNPDNVSYFFNVIKETKENLADGKKCFMLFKILFCGSGNEKTDVLDFTRLTLPSEFIVDSGEASTTLQSTRDTRRRRR